MKIRWVLSEETPSDLIDPEVINSVGESWGHWGVRNHYALDNCICVDDYAENLVSSNLQSVCNLYIPRQNYEQLGRPDNVSAFDGTFGNSSISNKADIVALNFVSDSDIVLLVGFNFSPVLNTDEKALQESRLAYYFDVRAIMQSHPDTQFVLIENKHKLASWALDLNNLSEDTVDSVTNLLS
jgi:hypothetical protein